MRTAVAAAVACALLTGLSVAADVQASIKKEVSIPAGGLGPALRTLSDERKIHFVFVAEDVNQLRTPGATGTVTTEDALRQLLKGTGLTYRYIDDETISILPHRTTSVPPSLHGNSPHPFAAFNETEAEQPTDEGRGASFWSRFRLAQVDQASQPASSSGGNAEPKQLTLEEVIVTAQKREERLQDVPISMSVLSGVYLDRSTVSSVVEELSRVPGVSINQNRVGAQVPIRGVAAGLAVFSGASPTAYYLDSVPFGFVKSAIGPDPDVYDLERLEVLRGPQGTLYGASALNGVVRVLTQDANPNEFEFKARTSASSTQDGAENFRGDAAVNVPIVDGKLAVRAVVGYQDLGGWIDKPNDKDANEAERRSMRLRIKAQPTEQLSIGLTGWSSRADYGAPPLGLDGEVTSVMTEEPTSIDYDVYGFNFGYDFSGFSIVSTSSYLDYANHGIGAFPPPSPFLVETHLDATTFAQEIILNSTHRGSWRWSIGGMYRDGEDELFQHIPGVFLTPTDIAYSSESYAAFGELTRLFLEGRWEFTAGLRYFEDDTAQKEVSRGSAAVVLPSQLVNSETKFHATTPRVVLTWHPREQTTFYTSYSEGFRSGSDQSGPVLAVDPQFPPVEPDTLKNYEVGAKGSFWGDRVNFDTALYYIDWQDVQQALTVRTVTQGLQRDVAAVLNGDSASGVGFEFALTVAPVEAFEFGANFSWNDLTVDSTVISGGVVLLDKGDRLNYSPEYTAGAWADYVFPFGANGIEGRLSVAANYTSEQSATTLAGGAARLAVGDPMLIGRTSFSVRTPNHWTATLFADNVNNERGVPVRSTSSPVQDVRVSPRTVGVQFEYRF